MPEELVSVVDEIKLREKVNSFKKKDTDIKSAVVEVFRGLWFSQRPHKPIVNEIDFTELIKSFPQFREVIKYVQQQVIISKRLVLPFHICPILLIGEPGLGKTYFVAELAKILALPSHIITFSNVTANFALTGGSLQWGRGKTGLIIEAFASCKVANPIMTIDELDKLGSGTTYNPMNAFYPLLEPHTARKFRDEAIDIDVDLSRVIWFATANEEHKIPMPILSRFKRFEIKQPSPEEMLIVIDSVYLKMRKDKGLETLISPELDQKVKVRIASFTPRDVRLILDEALGSALVNFRYDVITDDLPNFSNGERRVGFL